MFHLRNQLFVLLFSIFVIKSEATRDQAQNPNCPTIIDVNPGEAVYVTPYIRSGNIVKAQQLTHIEDDEITKIAPSYSGYFTVNEKYESNMFFWYFPAKINPETAPVLLWLQGGPGGSSMFGLFFENGPFSVNECGQLNPREYSWHINHHLIYLDNPVGTGFSFTRNDAGFARNEIDVGNNLYEAIKQFFLLFPNLQNHKFYISGESYAGKYVPALGYTILTKNSNDLPKINLDGLLIGDAYTDPINELNIGEYLYQLGFIDSKIQKVFDKYASQTANAIRNKEFEKARVLYASMINQDSPGDPSLFYNNTGLMSYYNYYDEYFGTEPSLTKYLNTNRLHRSIHVGKNKYNDLGPQNIVQVHLNLDAMDSVADLVIELLSHYRIVFYNGQFDVICAYPLVENMIKNWNFSGSEEYYKADRHIWRVDSKVAGYVKQGGNLTTLLVRNAGHMVPHDQPKWVLDLVIKFIANNLVFA